MTTYEVIEHIDLPSGASSNITFSNIPSDYEDLIIKASLRSTQSGADVSQLRLSFNGSTSSFTKNFIQGNGNGGVNAYGGTDSQCGYLPAALATSSTFGNVFIHIVKYTASENKSFTAQVVSENSGATAFQVSHSGYWASTAAINSIGLSALSANLSQYSSATLYGVRKYNTATKSPKATGGIISYDSVNNTWVHTFTASGTFTPTQNLTADYLVVAGGGGGARGGGGAGGLRSTVDATGGGGILESALSLTASTGYTVTVGAGGAGTNWDTGNGGNGSNTTFSTITSTGGGGGGDVNNFGQAGGSGGGGGSNNNITGGSGTANQGYDGGDGWTGSNQGGGGGGGGAGQAGGDLSSQPYGGDGVQVSITGSSLYYAGGGAGNNNANGATAPGGLGGGGDAYGNTNTAGDAGVPGFGGGGGGSIFATSGNGGSGVVIVRYAA